MILLFVAISATLLCPAILADGHTTTANPPTAESRRAFPPVPRKQWTPRARIWTARSCVGEAGWLALEECTAIAWVYAKRARDNYKPYLWIVRRYSAATKSHEAHRRPWLLKLRPDNRRPDGWPGNLSWRKYKPLWVAVLDHLDRWATGKIPDQLPEANHFGSGMDAKLVKHRWKRVEAPDEFRNWFFNSRERPD